MRHWTRYVRPSGVPPEVQQLRQAAEDLGHHAGRAPGRARVSFQTVSDVIIGAAIAVGGAAAAYHLYEKLTRHPDRHGPAPGQEGGDDRHPRRHAAAAAGHGRH
jgi:hypothetical protein